eukprot:2339638-Prymnesium_polylepis.2
MPTGRRASASANCDVHLRPSRTARSRGMLGRHAAVAVPSRSSRALPSACRASELRSSSEIERQRSWPPKWFCCLKQASRSHHQLRRRKRRRSRAPTSSRPRDRRRRRRPRARRRAVTDPFASHPTSGAAPPTARQTQLRSGVACTLSSVTPAVAAAVAASPEPPSGSAIGLCCSKPIPETTWLPAYPAKNALRPFAPAR